MDAFPISVGVLQMLAIRDDLFLTFRPQRTSIVDSSDVQQTADSLHRCAMILDPVLALVRLAVGLLKGVAGHSKSP